jgi:3-hydroxyacyl-CoA dehydrogenase
VSAREVSKAGVVGLGTMGAGIAQLCVQQPRFAPPPTLVPMLKAGRLGRKSGRGFFEYAS